MKPSMIVYGVPGGKTRFAERIAKFYGFDNFHQGSDFHVKGIDEVGFIESTEWLHEWEGFGFDLKSFEEVAKEINAAIPLTDWLTGWPTRQGIYERQWNFSKTEANLDYYKARGWHWGDGQGNFEKSPWAIGTDMKWRGLSEEPINTKE